MAIFIVFGEGLVYLGISMVLFNFYITDKFLCDNFR